MKTLAAGLCGLSLCATAMAHRVLYPKIDRLELSPQGLRLQIEYLVPDLSESATLFRLYDRDRSGALDAKEQQALRDQLATLASAFVSIELDGKPLALARQRAELLESRRDQPLSVTVTHEAKLGLAAGEHTLRVSDRHKDRTLFVPLRVTSAGIRIITRLLPQPLLSPGQPFELRISVPAAPP